MKLDDQEYAEWGLVVVASANELLAEEKVHEQLSDKHSGTDTVITHICVEIEEDSEWL